MATTVLTPTPAKLATPRTVSLGRQQLREFMESKVAVAGLALFVTIIAVAVLAAWTGASTRSAATARAATW
jgi:hypothetical protein